MKESTWMLLLSVVVLFPSMFFPGILFAETYEGPVVLRDEFSGVDMYNKIYQNPISITNAEGIKGKLWPVTDKKDTILTLIKSFFNKKMGEPVPAVYFMPIGSDPVIYRWNETEGKYKEALTFPVDEDVVIVHDPNRLSGSATSKDRDENKIHRRYHRMDLGFNAVDQNGFTPHTSNLIDEEKPSKNTTFKYFKNEAYEDGENGNIFNLRFPVIRIPKEIVITKDDGSQKNYKVRYTKIDLRTMMSEYTWADGTTLPITEYDPGPKRIFCIPVDGFDKKVCEDTPYRDPIIPGKDSGLYKKKSEE